MRNFNQGISFFPAIIFKRWSRKPFAVFNSLHRVINISVLTGTFSLILATQKSNAQTDTITIQNHQELDEVLVSSSRTPKVFRELSRMVSIIPKSDLQSLPTSSVNDVLKSFSGIDIRQRGANDMQADVSIRGGSYEQTLILLNGIPLNDPQTGHHNLNLPIDLSLIDHIEILYGPGSRIYGPNALSGAINFTTQPEKKQPLTIHLTGGQNLYFKGSLASSFTFKKTSHMLAISASTSDGFITNTDYKLYQLFYQGATEMAIGKLTWQTGYLNKGFGAQGFYSARFPEQFEQIRNKFASVGFKTKKQPVQYETQLYWKRNHDRFELFREDEYQYQNGYYIKNQTDTAKYNHLVYTASNYYSRHNYHLTDILGAAINSSYTGKFGVSSVGADFRYEHIYSNVLGKMTDTVDAPGETRGKFFREASRNYVDIFGEHCGKYKNMDVTVGILWHYNSQYQSFVNGGGEVGYRFNSFQKLYVSINQSVRIPTFTDLYYDGPDNIGNPNLKPEKALTYELGYKYHTTLFQWNTAVFIREMKDAIDWIRNKDSVEYTPLNYSRLTTSGFEFSARLNGQKSPQISRFINYLLAGYSFLNSAKDLPENIESYYSMDYLRHKLFVSGCHPLYKSLQFSWTLTYQDRNGTWEDLNKVDQYYPLYVLMDAKVFWAKPTIEIYFEGRNILNTTYFDLGGITQSGFWAMAGIKWKVHA